MERTIFLTLGILLLSVNLIHADSVDNSEGVENSSQIKQGAAETTRSRLHPNYRELPDWAHHCALPPGLTDLHLMPPGWQIKCRAGKKYYEHEEEYRLDLPLDTKYQRLKSPYYFTLLVMDHAFCRAKSIRSGSALDIPMETAKKAVHEGWPEANEEAMNEAPHGEEASDRALTADPGRKRAGQTIKRVLAGKNHTIYYERCMKKHGHRWKN